MSDPTILDRLTITPIRVPGLDADVHAPEFEDFRAAIEVRNRVGEQTRGTDSVTVTPEQSLPQWHATDEEVHGWILRTGDRVAGRVLLYVPLEEGSRRAQVRVEVLSEFGGRGFGTRALAFVEERARERGRDILQSWTEHPPAEGARVAARTGFGAVPTDAASTLLAHAGYALEQVYRISTLDLTGPLDALESLRVQATAASTGYRYVSWVAPTPPEWVDDYAWMKSRMSTDAPAGDSVVDEEVWDAERLRSMEARNAASGMTMLVGAAQHLATGRLVAFTELVMFTGTGVPIDQNDTLVLAEHRGHRLGMLVKTETLRRARAVFPTGDRIVTGNAEENRPMLSINEEMGFTPTRYAGEWQKREARA
ncbi:GNAT family N-acetyltransferase [Microbacterium sp. RU33B]|uniref:GNAT family N-acetyltransferase n=1 Tax=Microbacterium sp. RU33B TaxID=1907390 RepID=UPI00095E1874|nr:GNAT family N-acetyltransferase [Microbacterium sp. RU33B]SIT73082.1 hypothetical protein SAMN05880545_1155 [Microbacterium sp. RU33B]